jgi:hypothetical protein
MELGPYTQLLCTSVYRFNYSSVYCTHLINTLLPLMALANLKNSYTLPSLESIRVDLQESPQWLLSSYGPGRDPPSQLIDGKDVSFEEVRLLAYDAQARGNTGVYVGSHRT